MAARMNRRAEELTELSHREMEETQGGGDLTAVDEGSTVKVGELPDIPIFRAPK